MRTRIAATSLAGPGLVTVEVATRCQGLHLFDCLDIALGESHCSGGESAFR